MAGFEVGEGYWLPRGNVKVPSELESQMWSWIEEAETYIVGFGKNDKPTTMEFLRFLKFLRRVFIQDTAAMMCTLETDPEPSSSCRLSHHIFSRFSILSSPEFQSYKTTMAEQLVKATPIDNDPKTQVVERCFPGLNKRFDLLQNDLQRLFNATEESNSQMEEYRLDVNEAFTSLEKNLNESAKRRQFALVSALSDYFRRGITQQADDLGMHATRISENTNTAADGDAESPVLPGQQPTEKNDEFFATPVVYATPVNREREDSLPALPVTQSPARTPENKTPTIQESESSSEMADLSNKILSFRFIGNTALLSLSDVYSEFFGIGEWTNQPVLGGFYGLEQRYKSKWRSGYSAPEQNFFSRTQSLLKGLCDKVNCSYGEWNDDIKSQCEEWDPLIKKKGIAGTLRFLQGTGDIGKKGQRKRNEA